MTLLRDDLDALGEAFTRVSQGATVPPIHVEKDYWLTECLRGVVSYASEHGLFVVLKGETSLSKGYQLIDRFSEDADLIVVFGDETALVKNRHLKGLVAAAEEHTGLPSVVDEARTRKGIERIVTLQYREDVGEPIPPKVKIELHTIGGTLPHTSLPLRSLLAEHWSHVDAEMPDVPELVGFEMFVLEPCRTLVEKLVILHEAHTRDGDDAHRRQVDTVRHYFDVWHLLQREEVLEALARHKPSALAREVKQHSVAAKYRAVDRPAQGFAASPAFAMSMDGEIADAYKRAVAVFAWNPDTAPTFEACVQAVRERASQL